MTARFLGNVGFFKIKSTDNHHIAAIHSKSYDLSLVKEDGGLVSLNQGAGGYSDVQKFINDAFSIMVYEKTAGNVLRRLGYNQKTCTTKVAGFTESNDELKQE